VPAVTWPGTEQGARISPDGRWLSFIADRQNQLRIYVQAIDGGDAVPVSLQGSPVSHEWSPDSRELAVVIRQGQSQFLMLVPAFFGGSPRITMPIDPALSDIQVLRWVDDDVYFDVNRSQPGRALLHADLRSQQIDDLSAGWPAPLRSARSMDVSSDARRLVVSATVDGVSDLLVAALDGSGVQRLTSDEYVDRYPLWIDDRTIAFESNRGGQLDLWEISTRTKAARQLTSSQMRDEATSASADGKVIAFEQTASQVNLWHLDLASGALRQLTADSLSDFWPSSSAAGGLIAFQRMKPTSVEGFQFFDTKVLVAPMKGDSLEPQAVADGFSARLSPDGRWIAYYQRLSDRRHLRLVAMNLSTGEPHVLSERCVLPSMTAASLPVDFIEQNVTWSPSGAVLFFIVATDQGHEIQSANVASATPPSTVVAAAPGGQLWDVRLSPDGRQLAYVTRIRGEAGGPSRQQVHVYSLNDRRDRVLPVAAQDRSSLNVAGWSRDDAVIVVRRSPRAGQVFELALAEVSVEGSQRELAVVPDGAVPAVRVDAAHGRLFVTRSVEGVHNVFAVSLRDGAQRQVTANQAPGVSFSGIQPVPVDAIVFAREEWKRDIWLLTSGSRRQ
jgi:Tol biopolymer transport system component